MATGACLAQQQPSGYSGDCSSAAAIAIVIAKLLTSAATGANAGTDHSRIHAKSSAGVSYFPGVLHVVHLRLGWWGPPLGAEGDKRHKALCPCPATSGRA